MVGVTTPLCIWQTSAWVAVSGPGLELVSRTSREKRAMTCSDGHACLIKPCFTKAASLQGLAARTVSHLVCFPTLVASEIDGTQANSSLNKVGVGSHHNSIRLQTAACSAAPSKAHKTNGCSKNTHTYMFMWNSISTAPVLLLGAACSVLSSVPLPLPKGAEHGQTRSITASSGTEVEIRVWAHLRLCARVWNQELYANPPPPEVSDH
eukprot:3210581-Amphidinium_carterae.1